ncbi:heparinase, partial [Mesorhizobium sp. M4A.F.Ca.ET.090.04.2.1]
PLLHAPHSGYERLSMGGVTVIADTGLPPPVDVSNAAHAGCLAFEMSSGRQHYIVNAGIDTYGAAEFRPLARATAAHSTATVNDTSSARFSHSLRVNDLLGSPLIGGPQHVPCKRTDLKGSQGFLARHDGYVQRFGFLHEREMKLSSNGNVLTGRDRFQRPGGAAIRNNGRDFVAVRFHVHPDINLLQDEHDRLVLAADQGDTWVFTCAGIVPEVEESIYFAGLGGPRRSRQIVLAFKASEISEVHWQLTRTTIAGYPENN